MKIRHRIHARKVILAYFFHRRFVEYLCEQKQLLSDAITIANMIHATKDQDKEQTAQLQDQLMEQLAIDPMSQVAYIIEQFWKQRVPALVDTYTTSFSYKQMDIIDQCLFLIGCIEYATYETPKEVIINEMIELSKRYGDSGSAKLINGILHHIVEQEDLPALHQQDKSTGNKAQD